jgi:hypothetical protein
MESFAVEASATATFLEIDRETRYLPDHTTLTTPIVVLPVEFGARD